MTDVIYIKPATHAVRISKIRYPESINPARHALSDRQKLLLGERSIKLMQRQRFFYGISLAEESRR